MAKKSPPILDAQDNPDVKAAVQNFITLFRRTLAPLLNADMDNLPMNQSAMLTAGAMFAGLTAGHMLAVGVLADPADRDSAKLVAMQAFDTGLMLGLHEARQAMLREMRGAGRG